jgi:glycosyltransferase involved in cell wall biosynthesis
MAVGKSLSGSRDGGRVVWAPTWGTPCGIAEYTRHLAQALGEVTVTAGPPVPEGTAGAPPPRLLHVQHEFGSARDEDLTRTARAVKWAGGSVVVTKHSVRPGDASPECDDSRAWEWEADALVALTAAGAAELAARWPGKRVEHIPIGCEKWLPPHKASRGRVIGAFGFLEPRKGFWKLLDVLRAVPGTELLLFSHDPTGRHEPAWDEAARGLPVRRVREFLPPHEIARRLAAEADVLAFWYDDVPRFAASAAVCIGLATGVPVLASPTQWFRDLRDVTWQPQDVVEGVRQLLEDTTLRTGLTAAAADYCRRNAWGRVAARHERLWAELEGHTTPPARPAAGP